MKFKITPGKMLLFTVAAIQLTVVGAYVFAALSNGVDGREMLPYWAHVLLLNGAADLLAFLVWVMFSSGGSGGRKRQYSTISHASPSASASRA